MRGGIAHVRGEIELRIGTPAMACTLLVEGAELLIRSDPAQAADVLVLATWGALAADQLDRVVAGLVEAAVGVEAAGRELEDIAEPLSAREARHRDPGESQDKFTYGREQRRVPATPAA